MELPILLACCGYRIMWRKRLFWGVSRPRETIYVGELVERSKEISLEQRSVSQRSLVWVTDDGSSLLGFLALACFGCKPKFYGER